MTLKLLRRYALVLVAGLLVAVASSTGRGPATAAAASATGDCAPASSWPAQNGSFASQVLTLVNQHRAGMGLGQLVISPTLSAAAVWKARHMAAYNYMAHDDPAPPVARTAADRIATCGYKNAGWGENIAYGYTTAQAVFSAWLSSPGHKANIENNSYVATGIGAATGSNGTSWAQDFGTVADGGQPPTTTTTPPPTTTAPPPPPPTTTTPTTTTAPTTTTVRTTTTTTPTTTAAAPTTTTTGSNPPAKTTAAAPAPVAIALSSAGLRVAPHRLALVTHVALTTQPTPATPVHVKCKATAGGRHLRVLVNAFGGQAARCVWRVPSSLHGKVVHGWVRVELSGSHVRRSFAASLR